MGKPTATQPKPKRDGFFNKKQGLMKKIRPFRESAIKSGKIAPSSSADSGSFFVTSTEKQELLAKRNTNQKSKVERKNNAANKSSEEKPKKVFDKKLWRIQKYSKKYKLDQWEEKRKKKVLHQYYKQIDDDEPKFDVQKIYEQYKDEDEDNDDELDNKSEEIENENNLNKNIIEDKIEIAKQDPNEPQASASQTRKNKAFKKAHLEYQRIQDEKKQRKEDREKQKVEKAEALKEYKQKKLEKYKKLNKKTKKGQPIMKYRMEMLLEQIQKSVQQ